MSGYVPALLFPDDTSHDFVLGAEVGMEYERLQREEGVTEAIMHAENAEMILRLAEATARTAQSEEMGDGWLHVTFSAPNRDSGFQRGDRVIVNGEPGTVLDGQRTPKGTIRVQFDDGPDTWPLLALVEREAA